MGVFRRNVVIIGVGRCAADYAQTTSAQAHSTSCVRQNSAVVIHAGSAIARLRPCALLLRHTVKSTVGAKIDDHVLDLGDFRSDRIV